MVKKYSKIVPPEYFAVQWTEDNWVEVRDFVGNYNIRLNPNNPENTFYIVDGTHDTYEEMDFVHLGDYIVKENEWGFPYCVSEEIFKNNFRFKGYAK